MLDKFLYFIIFDKSWDLVVKLGMVDLVEKDNVGFLFICCVVSIYVVL